jgi:hypothetical protein
VKDSKSLCEHPSHAPIPLPDDAEIVGRVVWMAKTLIEE